MNVKDSVKPRHWRSGFLSMAFFLLPAGFEATAQENTAGSLQSMLELPLSDLMALEVTSVSKKRQPLADAAAAVSVISQDDIRRTGVRSIPEALRLVPGMHVAMIDANKWTVSARGFSGIWANKLLVLMDGRSLYTPLFGGVYWDVQGTLMSNIERIEVIRGPGATLWGANAVNGVINIITRAARERQGGEVRSAAGSDYQAINSLHYGGELASGHYRLYAKQSRRRDGLLESGGTARDRSDINRIGGRLDIPLSTTQSLTLQGEWYRGNNDWRYNVKSAGSVAPQWRSLDEELNGWHVLGHWRYDADGNEQLSVKAYLDHTERRPYFLTEHRDILDVELQHRFSPAPDHEIVWGLGYRLNHDKTVGSFGVSVAPDERRTPLYSGFVQDEVTLSPDRLKLVLGVKFEDDEFSDLQTQPSIRLLWSPDQHRTLWAAVSRAIRTPSRFERDGRIHSTLVPQVAPLHSAMVMGVYGNPDYRAEELLAHEMGFRQQLTPQLNWDLSLFYNDYDNLQSNSSNAPRCFPSDTPPPCLLPDHLINPYITLDNDLEGVGYGGEFSLNWQAAEWWRLQGHYSYLMLSLNGGQGVGYEMAAEGSTPKHQLSLRASLDIGESSQFGVWFRYVDDLPALDVDGYSTVDVHFRWRATEQLSLSVSGKNLLEPHHLEYREQQLSTFDTLAERGFFAELNWEF